jgi:carbamoyl-phosphate synthase large subunit
MEGGGSVVAVDISPHSPALYFADEHYLVPRSDASYFISAVGDICQKSGVNLIVPTRDEELVVFADHRDEFRRKGIEVAVAESSVIRRCQDKNLFHDFCIAHGFIVPERLAVGGWDVRKLRYPVFVKPRVGKGGKGARTIGSAKDMSCICVHDEDLVVEEFIDADEFTVDLFSDFSGKLISAVARQRVVVVAGESYVSRTVISESLVQESARLASKLGLVAHNTIQAFVDDGIVKFIEVNPRYGGAASLGFQAGAFTPQYLIRLVMGRDVDTANIAYKEGMVMLRYTNDVFIDNDSVLVSEG